MLSESWCRVPTAISGSCSEEKKYLGNKMFCTVWLKLKNNNPTTSNLRAETNCEKSYPIHSQLTKENYEK